MSTSATLQQLSTFGRKYRLDIKFPPDERGNQTILTVADSEFDESLRITFDVYAAAWQVFWYADISIYNLDEATTLQILGDNTKDPSGIKQGMEVVLSAGYQNGNFGVIWDGFVMQPMWDRENVTDFKITLHCVIGLDELTRNFVNRSYAQINQQDLVKRMAQDCFRPFSMNASSSISNKSLPRGRTVFGNPRKFINAVADDNNMQAWLDAGGFNIASLTKDVGVSTNDVIVYTPTTGIVETPQQTEYGVNFKLLLDPRVRIKKPSMQVKIDNTVIRQQKKQIGVLPGLLDQDGQYIVIATRYVGDTRGQAWYTEVTGLTSLDGYAALIQTIGTAIDQ